jgi:hypothetical protein
MKYLTSDTPGKEMNNETLLHYIGCDSGGKNRKK